MTTVPESAHCHVNVESRLVITFHYYAAYDEPVAQVTVCSNKYLWHRSWRQTPLQ